MVGVGKTALFAAARQRALHLAHRKGLCQAQRVVRQARGRPPGAGVDGSYRMRGFGGLGAIRRELVQVCRGHGKGSRGALRLSATLHIDDGGSFRRRSNVRLFKRVRPTKLHYGRIDQRGRRGDGARRRIGGAARLFFDSGLFIRGDSISAAAQPMGEQHRVARRLVRQVRKVGRVAGSCVGTGPRRAPRRRAVLDGLFGF
mmetsp:Transcript_25617/g.86078  ORF Transcript_25617/g.86078 Transcript_25617/m.86078 type:complete len:201 (+) Transcript_25617:308-910(+)